MKTSAPPVDRCDLRQRVEKALDAHVTQQRQRLDSISVDLGQVVDALADFVLSSGKRLRPAFAYWGWRGAGGPDADEIVTAVSCLEWLHACALVHDDVMDGSATRRGRPAMHRRFASLHRQASWRGDEEVFGRSAAILLGDLCLVWADELFNGSGLPAHALQRGQPVYDEMRTELMAGQYLDMLAQAEGVQTMERALSIARYKSAKYTVERPLHLGGMLAGAAPRLIISYSAYGLPLGEAFQLRDDVLGVFGDPAQTGKPADDDLREGKPTVLIAAALDRASTVQAAEMQRHLSDPQLDTVGVEALRDIITDTGALPRVEILIERLTDRALAALDTAEIPDDARLALYDLAAAATTRTV